MNRFHNPHVALTTSSVSSASKAKLMAFAELTKLRISVMVLFTFCVAGVLAAGISSLNLWLLLQATLAMALIAFSGNAMNMYLERYTDLLMPRTARRPLPEKRLSGAEVVTFASICFVLSMAIFIVWVNWQSALCRLCAWVLYVLVYTPLKTQTWLNTEVGAIPGALPILIGALALTGTVPPISWAFFAVLLLWQFPHFMAISWMYRNQYRDGGLQMLTVVDPSGRRAGRKAIVTCILLIIASIVPALTLQTSLHAGLFVLVAFAIGAFYLRDSIRFARTRTDVAARKLLKTSIIYLPVYMLILVIARLA